MSIKFDGWKIVVFVFLLVCARTVFHHISRVEKQGMHVLSLAALGLWFYPVAWWQWWWRQWPSSPVKGATEDVIAKDERKCDASISIAQQKEIDTAATSKIYKIPFSPNNRVQFTATSTRQSQIPQYPKPDVQCQTKPNPRKKKTNYP